MATGLQQNSMKLLECPVCYNVFNTKIFMCHEGHNICEDCRLQTDKCPTCKSEYKGTRNYLVEELLSKSLIYTCENIDYGCKMKFPIHKLQIHHKSCPYRLLDCFAPACSWKSCFNELKHHIRTAHAVSVFQGLSKEILFSDGNFLKADLQHNDNMFVELNDELFVFIYKREKTNLLFDVIYIGPTENAKNFHFKLAFQNEDRTKKMELKCQVSTNKEGKFSDKCLKLDYNTCKQFVRYNGKLQYLLKVQEKPVSTEVFEDD